MYKNIRFHDEIRKWNTAQLIEALETNGLGDCCDAIQSREIDGDTFLNLTEGQLAFWRNTLNNIQIKRLWSIIQLARERPQDFIINTSPNLSTSNIRKIEKIKSPISESLEKSLGNLLVQQETPTSQQIDISENNYPKIMPIMNLNNFPPKPNQLPPKPLNFNTKKLLTEDTNEFQYRPTPSVPPTNLYPKPPITLVPPPPSLEEENVYEEEPMTQSPNNFLPPTNSSYLFKKQESITNVKREVPVPSNLGRPLPAPPKDEQPYPFPPNVTAIAKNARSGSNLFKPPPVFRPPSNIPYLHDNDDEQPEYDSVDEAHIPVYKLQSWYKDIDRREASRLLQGRPNGTFIARPSKQAKYECSFSVIYENKTYNLAVMKENDKLILGKNAFNSVIEIVDKFKDVPLVLNGPGNEDVYVTLRNF